MSKGVFVDVKPSFEVIRNFSELKHTLESLCTAHVDPAGREESPDTVKSPKSTPKILCVWDVDDTLVASGSFGVRQSPVFRDTELRPLFKSLYGKARHLLLSQGSIDDVFESDGSGRLRYLRDYFFKEHTAAVNARERAKEEKPKGVASWLNCGSSEPKKPRVNPSSLGRGTVMVRLSTIRGPREAPEDTEFITNPACPVPSYFKVQAKKEESEAHWLVLRPSTHGISLASLHNLIVPSTSTAFVDGKYFRKSDIVWSLASSGFWDTVFFIDNNLSELGIVKYGINPKKLASLEARNQAFRFYEGDYLLMSMSARLRELEVQFGREVCRAPEELESEGVGSSSPSDVEGVPHPPRKEVSQPGSGSNGISEDYKVEPAVRSNSLCPTCAHRENTCLCEDDLSLSSRNSNHHSNSPSGSPKDSPDIPEKKVKLVMANLHIPSEHFRRIIGGAFRPEKGMEGSDTTTSARTGGLTAAVPKFRNSTLVFSGQPTFLGDIGVKDEEYDHIIDEFRKLESLFHSKILEDVETKGYVLLRTGHRRNPSSAYMYVYRFPRPSHIVHYSRFYESILDRIEKEIIQPIKTKEINKSNNLYTVKGIANSLQHYLHKRCVFIDPYVTGKLAEALFMFYSAEGTLPKSSLKGLQEGVQFIRNA